MPDGNYPFYIIELGEQRKMGTEDSLQDKRKGKTSLQMALFLLPHSLKTEFISPPFRQNK